MIRILSYIIVFHTLLLSSEKAKSQVTNLQSIGGKVAFISDAPNEFIKSENIQIKSAIDKETGEIAVLVPISGFEFKKKLMKKHFNEQYLESDQYPESTFEGIIKNLDQVISNSGKSEVPITGKLTIHGVENQIECKVEFILRNDILRALTRFSINLDDYNIKVPKMFQKKISKLIIIEVELKYSDV